MEQLLSAELWIKLLLSFGCGAAIGIERELSDKPAGLRTNMLICVGSTVITMVSIHVALDYASHQVNISDPGRIAAQIVSGIGFIGAGTIIQARGSVHGLTTAATIWVMAGVGLAVGSGNYGLAVGSTALLLVILAGLRPLEMVLLKRRKHFVHFRVKARREADLVERLNRIAAERKVPLEGIGFSRRGEDVHAEFALTCAADTRDAILSTLLHQDDIVDVHVSQ